MENKKSIIYELKCEYALPMSNADPLSIAKAIRITDSEGHEWRPVIVEYIPVDQALLIHLALLALKGIDKANK
jgi:hypothetical protein